MVGCPNGSRATVSPPLSQERNGRGDSDITLHTTKHSQAKGNKRIFKVVQPFLVVVENNICTFFLNVNVENVFPSYECIHHPDLKGQLSSCTPFPNTGGRWQWSPPARLARKQRFPSNFWGGGVGSSSSSSGSGMLTCGCYPVHHWLMQDRVLNSAIHG